MNINEQIEAYLEGGMGKEEMASFEAKLKQDPLLKKEFDLQNNIINGIRQTRKAELKVRLNSIDVSGLSSSVSLSSIAAGIGIIAILSVGGYFLFFHEPAAPAPEQEIVVPDTTAEQQVPDEAEQPEPSNDSLADKPDSYPDEDSQARVTEADPEPAQVTPLREEPSEPEIDTDQLQVPQGLTGAENETSEEADDISIPEMELDTAIPSRTEEIEIEMRSRRKYDFHYTFENTKLILYGDFSDEPYELIELKNDTGILLFLYYKDTYYNLDRGARDITPLEPVESEQIIIKLDQLKGN